MNALLDWLWTLTPIQAAAFALVENSALFCGSLLLGQVLVWKYVHRRVTPEPPPLERREVLLAIGCVVLNSVVTLAGWYLWKAGLIRIVRGGVLRVIVDVAVLLIAMDLLMYLFHRLAHVRWIFPIVHRTHHLYDRPRPLNLFVLNPAEVFGFGALWLILLCVYPSTWAGIVIYLSLNLLFGTIGHLGVEPFPRAWKRWPILKHVGSSTFHANHHQNERVNYGFYTDVWDRLFGTGA